MSRLNELCFELLNNIETEGSKQYIGSHGDPIEHTKQKSWNKLNQLVSNQLDCRLIVLLLPTVSSYVLIVSYKYESRLPSIKSSDSVVFNPL